MKKQPHRIVKRPMESQGIPSAVTCISCFAESLVAAYIKCRSRPVSKSHRTDGSASVTSRV